MKIETFEDVDDVIAGIQKFMIQVRKAIEDIGLQLKEALRDKEEQHKSMQDHVSSMMAEHHRVVSELKSRLEQHESSEEWRVKRLKELKESHSKMSNEADKLSQEIISLEKS